MKGRICRAVLLTLIAISTFSGIRAAHAQNFTESVLYTFCAAGACTDGEEPLAALVQGTDGNLYGTASTGGDTTGGAVFEIMPTGTLTSLYSFCALPGCGDGSFSTSALVVGMDGNFYGTTDKGGAYSTIGGTVFKMTPAGALLTLYSFCSAGGSTCADGQDPETSLLQGTDGNFYGTTAEGGAEGLGTVFKITPEGALTMLYSFCAVGGTSCTDGENPYSALVEDTNGNFFGTTSAGGAYGGGTVFMLTPAGTLSTLHNFCSSGGSNCTDGQHPITGLVQGTDGNFYGTTFSGGGYNSGTVFKITTAGALTTLYSFCSQGGANCTDGEYPRGGLVQGTDGDFYGTTSQGGTISINAGLVFKITSAGTLTTIYNFGSQAGDGGGPYAGLALGKDGNFYGTTAFGGANDYGTVFKLSLIANVSSTTISVMPNPVVLPQLATTTVTVTGSDGTPTGDVNFTFNGTTYGPGQLNASGMTTFQVDTKGLSPGTYPIVVTYLGSTVYSSSTATANLVVTKAPSSTTFAVSPTSLQVGQTITLTGTTSGNDGTPAGSVNFNTGGTTVTSGTLNSSGIATVTADTNGLPPGTYSVVATYSGNQYYGSSQSSAVSVTLEKASTATAVSGAPTTVTPPASVTLVASVRRSATGRRACPRGTVTFYYQTTAIGTGT